MGSILEALHQLQVIELKLATIRRTREAKAREVQIQRRKVEKAQERLEENRHTRQGQQIRLDALNLDVAAREESIDSHRQALNKAKTNKEYAAILTAMNTEKADNSKLEDDVLQLMDSVQALNEADNEIESESARLQERVAACDEKLNRFESESRERREGLETERQACAEAIPPTALATFNRVAERHEGEAMAVVDRVSPKRDDYICAGCNMMITLEVINSLRTRDEIQTCAVCGRLLYIETAVR